jgi:hypothetical protein
MTDQAFISRVETWFSGGQPMDIVTLQDGSVVLITETAVVLYANFSAFEGDIGGRAIDRQF